MNQSNAPVPTNYAHLPQWAFGSTTQKADALCTLVLEGKKTATCRPIYQFEDDPAPEPGDRTVLPDGDNRARCVIEFTATDVLAFEEVDAAFAKLEGEGDLSLARWRKDRQKLFTAQGYFAADMLLLCQHFKVIERFEYKRVAR